MGEDKENVNKRARKMVMGKREGGRVGGRGRGRRWYREWC